MDRGEQVGLAFAHQIMSPLHQFVCFNRHCQFPAVRSMQASSHKNTSSGSHGTTLLPVHGPLVGVAEVRVTTIPLSAAQVELLVVNVTV